MSEKITKKEKAFLYTRDIEVYSLVCGGITPLHVIMELYGLDEDEINTCCKRAKAGLAPKREANSDCIYFDGSEDIFLRAVEMRKEGTTRTEIAAELGIPERLLNKYLAEFGDFIKCGECGVVIPRDSNRRKYCKECKKSRIYKQKSEIRRREGQKERVFKDGAIKPYKRHLNVGHN